MKNSLWLTIVVFAGVILTMMYVACDHTSKEVVATENGSEAIKLISENGVAMAESVKEMEIKIKPAVKSKFGENVDFMVTDVQFLETQNQTAAFVTYITHTGNMSNVCILKQFAQPRPENHPCDEYQVWCTGTCGSNEACQVHGIIDPNGEITFSCVCRSCVLNVRCTQSGSGGS